MCSWWGCCIQGEGEELNRDSLYTGKVGCWVMGCLAHRQGVLLGAGTDCIWGSCIARQ